MNDPQAIAAAAGALLAGVATIYASWSRHQLARERAADKRKSDHHNELRAAVQIYKESTADLAEAKASAHREVERLFDLATAQRQTIERIETELAACEARREIDRREAVSNPTANRRRRNDPR